MTLIGEIVALTEIIPQIELDLYPAAWPCSRRIIRILPLLKQPRAFPSSKHVKVIIIP